MLHLQWWQWTLTVASVIGAVAVIWRGIRYIFKVDHALPILLKIASELENNGGSTLKDKIDKIVNSQAENLGRLEEKISEVVKLLEEQTIRAQWTVRIAEDSRLIAQTNSKIVEELTGVQTADIFELKEYIHEKVHLLNNEIAKAGLRAVMTEKRGERIEQRLDDLMPFVVRHREEDRSEDGTS